MINYTIGSQKNFLFILSCISWRKHLIYILFFLTTFSLEAQEDNGYRLWLKYDKIHDEKYREEARNLIRAIFITGNSSIMDAAKEELALGLKGLLGTNIIINPSVDIPYGLIIGKATDIQTVTSDLKKDFKEMGEEGYLIRTIPSDLGKQLVITANNDIGVLYGVFHFLRILQTEGDIEELDIKSKPALQWRMINHWDNIDGSVERGYAGMSLWKWEDLPAKKDKRYKDYARAMASIGVNGVALNNVNASPKFLTSEYLKKAAALADIFRPYGIQVFLSANFASPKALGELDTADPLEIRVQQWWRDKIEDVYELIPDFGGFLVKANSEGQPGPQDYRRSHADGANMMAGPLADNNGILLWRAFVYKSTNEDRVKDAYDEFAPLDGEFASNVFVQIKNSPLDFQPREPFSPLFGSMPETSQMLEFQITQEYLGFSTHLVYLAPMYQEVLKAETYAVGEGSTVARIIDGSLKEKPMTGMTGVANIGDVENWTGHPFGQANWYAYGRLAWDYKLSSREIAIEWIKMTLTKDPSAVETIWRIMENSHENLVNYQTPLGLNVLASLGHHYGPQPWKREFFHKADSLGLGFDRTSKGSNAVEQYFPQIRNGFENIESTPEKFLAWFHHVPWDYQMNSGRDFWEELCFRYYKGVEGVRTMQEEWASIKSEINSEIFREVAYLLSIQEDEAVWWRDANLWYFQKYSKRPIPEGYEPPRYYPADFKNREIESSQIKHYSTPEDVWLNKNF